MIELNQVRKAYRTHKGEHVVFHKFADPFDWRR